MCAWLQPLSHLVLICCSRCNVCGMEVQISSTGALCTLTNLHWHLHSVSKTYLGLAGRWAQQGVQLLRLGPEPHIAWSFKGGRLRARFSCITVRNPTLPQLAPTACSHGLVGTLGPVGFWYACQAEAFQAATHSPGQCMLLNCSTFANRLQHCGTADHGQE